MTELCELAYKYGSDKCPQCNHTYTPFYYDLLKDKRDSIQKVLEIGIGRKRERHVYVENYVTGAGLRMWRDFFPNAKIYGVDILPEALFTDKRIETFLCNAYKKEDLNKLIGIIGSDIDLVVDDGSHQKKQQVFTCQTLMPLLKKDVIYIIEDVESPNFVIESLKGYDCSVPPIQSRKGQNDNRLIIVKNK